MKNGDRGIWARNTSSTVPNGQVPSGRTACHSERAQNLREDHPRTGREPVLTDFDFISEQDEWEERFEKERLKEENEFLKEQLGLGEQQFSASPKTTPELENQFLQNIKNFEEADQLPKRTIRSLLPDDLDLAPADGIDERELSRRLNRILLILEDHGICLDLIGRVPDEVVYHYLLTEALNDELPMELPEGFIYHIDGCDGYCPQCFQRPYCETGKDPWPEDEAGNDTVV
jgi:hypothetical protein